MRDLIRFSVTLIIYILWVIWVGIYWFLLGIPIIVDIYLTKKVNWTPWKKREGKNHWAIEWLDALIFAVVAVTIINIFLFQNYKIPTGSMEKSLLIGDHLYVSKVAYGPRIPNTPFSVPFMQHTIPGTDSKSYSELIQWPYKRLAGTGKVKRNDPVVFNFPAGDTVIRNKAYQSVSIYHLIRFEAEERLKMRDQYANKPLKTDKEYYNLARQDILKEHDILVRPVDKRDNYIKRCVAVPGDSLQIIQGVVYINGEKQVDIKGLQYDYAVFTDGRRLNSKKLMKLGVNKDDLEYTGDLSILKVPLTQEMKSEIEKNALVQTIRPLFQQEDYYDYQMFPHSNKYQWNLDYYGPIYIPKKGATVEINMESLPLFKRIIGYYENNDLVVKDSTIYINGEITNSYTFKMDYYWMMGDNRHRSLDSRYWGYVPEDHIVGKPKFIWLSLNRDKSFPANIRLKRMFKGIK
ncbi:MAG: S26 family signal peptidase [Bacteroidales bacterium]|nr:S26 family signal peptidase [Bacteroidales bacterium]